MTTRLRVLLPAGLRPVKAPDVALDLFDGLRARGLPLLLRMLGPVLDEAYAAAVLERVAATSGVDHGEADREDMPRYYDRADVVWNTSRHEGGANALLEALGHGCYLYARDVPGNRDLLTDGAPGTLFDPHKADWLDRAADWHRDVLATTLELHRDHAERARQWIATHHAVELEMRALRTAYDTILNQ